MIRIYKNDILKNNKYTKPYNIRRVIELELSNMTIINKATIDKVIS